jgi:hypothetical protein
MVDKMISLWKWLLGVNEVHGQDIRLIGWWFLVNKF